MKSFIPIEVRGWTNDIIDSNKNWHFWRPWLKNLRNTRTFVHISANCGREKSWPIPPDHELLEQILTTVGKTL